MEREGIAYDVVPVIAAGIALASALGVSLTHRDHAKSVRFVTGHSSNGGLPEDVDWREIADPSATTIFCMARRTVGEIVARLVAMGCPAQTPVAIAASLGRPDQVLHRTTLQGVGATVEDIGLSKPLIVGIGEVFAAAARSYGLRHQRHTGDVNSRRGVRVKKMPGTSGRQGSLIPGDPVRRPRDPFQAVEHRRRRQRPSLEFGWDLPAGIDAFHVRSSWAIPLWQSMQVASPERR